MSMRPKATKTAMVKMLRDMGQDIPNSRSASFSTSFCRMGRSYWLRWYDSGGIYHVAYYGGRAERPVLQIDQSCPKITMADAIRYGMVEEVKEKKK